MRFLFYIVKDIRLVKLFLHDKLNGLHFVSIAQIANSVKILQHNFDLNDKTYYDMFENLLNKIVGVMDYQVNGHTNVSNDYNPKTQLANLIRIINDKRKKENLTGFAIGKYISQS